MTQRRQQWWSTGSSANMDIDTATPSPRHGPPPREAWLCVDIMVGGSEELRLPIDHLTSRRRRNLTAEHADLQNWPG